MEDLQAVFKSQDEKIAKETTEKIQQLKAKLAGLKSFAEHFKEMIDLSLEKQEEEEVEKFKALLQENLMQQGLIKQEINQITRKPGITAHSPWLMRIFGINN